MKLIKEALNDEALNKLMGRLNDSLDKLKKIVDENEPKAFTPIQKMQVRYAMNDLVEIQKKLGG